jgi:hypothetical protein
MRNAVSTSGDRGMFSGNKRCIILQALENRVFPARRFVLPCHVVLLELRQGILWEESGARRPKCPRFSSFRDTDQEGSYPPRRPQKPRTSTEGKIGIPIRLRLISR